MTIVVDEVTAIDTSNKLCMTTSNATYTYDKLILGIGSVPIVPGWLKGVQLGHVFTIPKGKDYLDDLQMQLSDMKRIAVIGAGFIGVEISDELCKAGKT